jgi:hypothetical protein
LAIFAAANQVPLFLATVPVIAAELLQAQGIHALIGRDIRARMKPPLEDAFTARASRTADAIPLVSARRRPALRLGGYGLATKR